MLGRSKRSLKSLCKRAAVDAYLTASGYSNEADYWNAVAGTTGLMVGDAFDAALTKWGYTGTFMDKCNRWMKTLNPNQSRTDSLNNWVNNLGGVLFFKNFSSGRSETLDADFSVGSATATFTATRTGEGNSPGTYVDANGVIQLQTATDNTPRYQGGYYDSTGFHAGNVGLMVEGAMTNRATYSGTPENAAWTKTNITADNDDAGSSSPDGVATANSLTASAGNGSFTQAYTDASAGVYTASLWIKRKTGTGVVNLRANTGDAYTAITTSVTSGWTRVSVSSSSLTNPTFDLQLVTSGDAVYVYGMQLEKNPYMTSYIPNATTALARGAEVLKYLIAGNRRADEESIYVKFVPSFTGTTKGNFTNNVMGTDTKTRIISDGWAGDFVVYPNNNDSATCKNGAITSICSINTSVLVTGVIKHSSPYIKLYKDGSDTSKDQTANDFTNPAWGTYMYIATSNGGTNQLNGIIQSVLIVGRANTAGEVLTNTNLLNAL